MLEDKLLKPNQSIVVIGLGATGKSIIDFITSLDIKVNLKVIDTRDLQQESLNIPDGVLCHTGGWNENWLSDADLIVVSPGVSLKTPQLLRAATKGIRIIGDIELFAWYVKAPVIGITGSNGKSTVTTLVGKIAAHAGMKVGVGGNIGTPALNLLKDKYDLYVLELSSFQLETTSSLKLIAATYLNLSEDHMNRYNNIDEYGAAKRRIFKCAETAIVNRNDKNTYPQDFAGKIISFGLNEEELGFISCDKEKWLAFNGEPIMAIKDIALFGMHNQLNILVAIGLVAQVNIDFKHLVQVCSAYSGLAHRCQLVANHNEVKWINDSKATNEASTLAALNGITIKNKLHLLLGGDAKGACFLSLQQVLNKLNVVLYCFGKDKAAFVELADRVVITDTMTQAMDIIYQNTQKGDVVLLSPACASLDQFASFVKRGEVFANYAKRLINDN